MLLDNYQSVGMRTHAMSYQETYDPIEVGMESDLKQKLTSVLYLSKLKSKSH